MSTKTLGSNLASAFCESVAVMHSAGIQLDEAVYLLGESTKDASLECACADVYHGLIAGKPLARALDDSGRFPSYIADMVDVGEHSGRLENVLWSLARYYNEEDRLRTKIKKAIAHPAALLCTMSAILLFVVIAILPAFVGAYRELSGSMAPDSFGYANASIVIGWIVLGTTLACTALAVLGVLASRSTSGYRRLRRLLERMPLTRGPLRQMAVSRFTAVLTTFTAAGVDTDTAMEKAAAMADHVNLKSQLEKAYRQMIDPSQAKGLTQAIFDNDVLEPVYARMLVVGARSNSLETVLANLSDTSFDDAVARFDTLADGIRPTLTAFLTVGLGAMLIAITLPLVAIMRSIG